jgi:primosomal protein N' (replication factor Y)
LLIERRIRAKEAARAAQNKIQKIGPSEDVIAKINDKYRKMIYLKAEDYSDLTDIKDTIETYMEENPDKQISITFDFSMMGNRKG